PLTPIGGDTRHESHVLMLQEAAGADEARHRDAAVVERVHGRGGILAVHHCDQQLHADRRSAGRMSAVRSASSANSRMRDATSSGSREASTWRQRCGSRAAISRYPAWTRWWK